MPAASLPAALRTAVLAARWAPELACARKGRHLTARCLRRLTVATTASRRVAARTLRSSAALSLVQVKDT
eukprot:CAMPEP_0176121312 /NCGR_PEP_ID=MMETSP0120_2-20121206/61057_1 /TAXON_ID=160619 /ORGANISM="Kryptoperidinium foliaceum, Strain CCMP 1326" /LENGTH=69 /DNA_ID=CAMNT_0017455847 /DNA_START=130 /DNA_END=335 /DNA_ORIENTATION=+